MDHTQYTTNNTERKPGKHLTREDRGAISCVTTAPMSFLIAVIIKFSWFTEGFSPSHFPFAEFFCEIPTLFQKIFLCRFQKTKKRPLHLFSRRSERKK